MCMKKLIGTLALIGLSACNAGGGKAAGGGGSAASSIARVVPSYTLNASRTQPGDVSVPGTLTLVSNTNIEVPTTLTILANGSEAQTAELWVGTVLCSYRHLASAVSFTFINGSCTDGSVPGSIIQLNTGDTVSLMIELTGSVNDSRMSATVNYY